MKVIILAAGKGTRMGDLTIQTPKPLLPFCEKTILFFILDSFKNLDLIQEIILVVREEHKKLFDSYISSIFFPKKIVVAVQNSVRKGTYGALESVKHLLSSQEEFLVTNGDDIHEESSIKNILDTPGFVLGVETVPFKKWYYDVVVDEFGYLQGFMLPKTEKTTTYLATGVYKLDYSFFDYPPIEIFGGEFGIPQTLVQITQNTKIRVVEMYGSVFINNQEELEKAQKIITHKTYLEEIR